MGDKITIEKTTSTDYWRIFPLEDIHKKIGTTKGVFQFQYNTNIQGPVIRYWGVALDAISMQEKLPPGVQVPTSTFNVEVLDRKAWTIDCWLLPEETKGSFRMITESGVKDYQAQFTYRYVASENLLVNRRPTISFKGKLGELGYKTEDGILDLSKIRAFDSDGHIVGYEIYVGTKPGTPEIKNGKIVTWPDYYIFCPEQDVVELRGFNEPILGEKNNHRAYTIRLTPKQFAAGGQLKLGHLLDKRDKYYEGSVFVSITTFDNSDGKREMGLCVGKNFIFPQFIK